MIRVNGANYTIEKQRLAKHRRNEDFLTEDFCAQNQIEIDISYMFNTPGAARERICRNDLEKIIPTVVDTHQQLKEGRGECKDKGIPMLGWQTLPDEITPQHIQSICTIADEFAEKIDAFISLGIGGSYLGIEATFKALSHTYFNQLDRGQRGDRPQVYFLGQNLDPDYFRDTLDMLNGKRIGINVISKSGTTTETAIAFRIMRDIIEKWAGEKAKDFILVTTDAERGVLRDLTNKKGYQSFIVPSNIGGRYSVLSDVGLVGLAVAGINIQELVAGFRYMKKRCFDNDDFWSNPSMIHAAMRHLAYEKGKKIEVVATNSMALYQVARWMEQLFPESEGHNGKGMWVSPSLYSEKLHANGQLVQDGERNIVETFLQLLNHDNTLRIPSQKEDLEGLNFLPDKGRDMNFINQKVIEGPAFAHYQGGVPNMTIRVPRRNAFNMGQLYYMCERSVGLSGYLLGHNPFIQPGVEDYKRAMFALAGKPGYEKTAEHIEEAIKNIPSVTSKPLL
ncbi:MAG: glucose-6-phosphate isomerase [bacterium]